MIETVRRSLLHPQKGRRGGSWHAAWIVDDRIVAQRGLNMMKRSFSERLCAVAPLLAGLCLPSCADWEAPDAPPDTAPLAPLDLDVPQYDPDDGDPEPSGVVASGTYYSVYAPFDGPIVGTEFYCDGGAYHPREPVRRRDDCKEYSGWSLPVDVESGGPLKNVYAYLSSSVASVKVVKVENICDHYACNAGPRMDKGVMLRLFNSAGKRLGDVVFGHVISTPYSSGTKISRSGVDPLYGYWSVRLGTVLDHGDITPGGCYRSHHTHMQARADTGVTLIRQVYDDCKDDVTHALTPIYTFKY
jgi:hypothetical protein